MAFDQASQGSDGVSEATHGLGLLAESTQPGQLETARDACLQLADLHAHAGLTGFLLVRQHMLFGYLEGPAPSMEAVARSVQDNPGLSLVRAVPLGELAARVCDGWEVRPVARDKLGMVGLDAVLEQTLRMRLVDTFEANQRQQIIRVARDLVRFWKLADDAGADCP